MLSVDLIDKFALIPEHWRPKVAAGFNGHKVRKIYDRFSFGLGSNPSSSWRQTCLSNDSPLP